MTYITYSVQGPGLIRAQRVRVMRDAPCRRVAPFAPARP